MKLILTKCGESVYNLSDLTGSLHSRIADPADSLPKPTRQLQIGSRTPQVQIFAWPIHFTAEATADFRLKTS